MNNRSGITLIESLAYITLLSVVMGSGAVSFHHLSNMRSRHEEYLYDIERVMDFGSRFKRIVRESERSLREYRGLGQQWDTLILEDDRSNVTIIVLKEQGLFIYTSKGTEKPKGALCLDGIRDVHFSVSSHGLASVTIQLKARNDNMKVEPVFIFSEQIGMGGEYVK